MLFISPYIPMPYVNSSTLFTKEPFLTSPAYQSAKQALQLRPMPLYAVAAELALPIL